MKRIALVTVLAAGIAACATFDYTRQYYEGPVTDHFDGTRFFNPDGKIGKGLLDVIEWRLKGEKAQWPDAVPLAAPDFKPPEREYGGNFIVTFVGHSTVLIQTAGLNILTDPIWSERAFMVQWAGPKRVTPPGIAFEDLPPIDVVLVSHNHYDHMDAPTLARLREKHDPLVIAPLGNDRVLHDIDPQMRVRTLDWWQHVELEGIGFNRPLEGPVRIHVVPVYHWSRRSLFDRNKALWGGFVIEGGGPEIYYAGDTGFGDGKFFKQAAERFGGFTYAILPVGAYEPRWFMANQHVNPKEAVEIRRLLGNPRTIGVHLRTFQLTDEAIGQPDIDLAQARRELQVRDSDFFTLPIGRTWGVLQ